MVLTGWSTAPGVPSLAIPVRSFRYSDPQRRINIPRPCRDLQTRKEMRERAWEVDGWADTVHKARSRTSCLLLGF
jgi:hypothetical protein